MTAEERVAKMVTNCELYGGYRGSDVDWLIETWRIMRNALTNLANNVDMPVAGCAGYARGATEAIDESARR